ncbi:MAG: PHP domain-containing protein [Halieaceae bacterium]
MIIDFHTHSHASDGELSPKELLRQAIAAGVQQFALTDHDTVAGYRELLASDEALPERFQLLAGVELSCVWGAATVHVVGLDMDIEHPQLAAGLERLDQARRERAAKIAEKLEKKGMPGALHGAREKAGISQIGRPHFAAWMVASGHVADANEAFDRYLGAGKVGDVKSFWPELAEVTEWITAAGGTAILAHPLKYRMTRMKLKRLLTDFRRAGGSCLEVYSGRQTADQTIDLCKLAQDFDLSVSAGSDFHRHWEYGPSLGVDVTRLPAFVSLVQAGTGA